MRRTEAQTALEHRNELQTIGNEFRAFRVIRQAISAQPHAERSLTMVNRMKLELKARLGRLIK